MNTTGETRRVRKSAVLGSRAELPTAKLAQRRLDLLLARINAPSYRPGRMATVEEFAERWKETVLTQHKPSSRHVAEIHLRRYILPKLGRLRLDQLGREVQQGFVTHLSRTASRKYLLNILGTLGAMLRTAESWGYVCEKIQTRLLALPERSVEQTAVYFTPEQVRGILSMAEGQSRVLFTTAVMTGLRSGELMGLRHDDLDFDRRVIHVRRTVWQGCVQTPKSRQSAKPVPMPEELASVLTEHLNGRQGWVFANKRGMPLDPRKIVTNKLQPILAALGLPRCGLHAFRHTHASMLVDTGASPTVARDQLRHSDVRTTMDVYAHTLAGAQRDAVDKIARIVALNGPKNERMEQWLH